MQKRKHKAQLYIKKYKASHRCIKCGEHDAKLLTFHHIGEKNGNIRDFVKNGSLRRLKEELTICELLCRKCHDAKHSNIPISKEPKELTQTDRNRALLMSLFSKETRQ